MQKIQMVRGMVLAGVLATAGFGVITFAGAAPKQDAPPQQGGMPDLPAGILATPGCLGVETGRMASGKQTIFAWFDNKKSVKKWYYSRMHQGVMESLAPGLNPDSEPLHYVSDDEGPILVIATLTMADRPHFKSMPNLPISQISIELYKPLPGGVHVGGRLAPESVKVDHMLDYSPPKSHDDE